MMKCVGVRERSGVVMAEWKGSVEEMKGGRVEGAEWRE